MLFKELTREEDLEISRLDGYDEGFANGESVGFSKGERVGTERGAAQEKLLIAKNLKTLGLEFDKISKSTGLTMSEVVEL